MKRAKRVIAALTMLFSIMVLQVLSAEGGEYEQVLCRQIEKLIRVSDADSDYSTFPEMRRKHGIAAVHLLAKAYALPPEPKKEVQNCMRKHDPSIDLFDGEALLSLALVILDSVGIRFREPANLTKLPELLESSSAR